MTNHLKVLFVCTILFLVVAEAKHKKKHKHKTHDDAHHFPKQFSDPLSPEVQEQESSFPQNPYFSEPPPVPFYPPFPFPQPAQEPKGPFVVNSIGNWELISENAGVSAMHINLLPTNKIIVFDAKVYRTSRIKLPEGVPCVPFRDAGSNEDKFDCFAHAVEYDIETNLVRPLQVCVICCYVIIIRLCI